jgi:2-deoxy-D-gluconate 3-dehydrogenase
VCNWGPFDLEGKVVAVTGGAMGIGFGACRRLVEAGATVLLTDVDGEAAERAAASLVGERVSALQLDVSAEDAGEQLVSACVDRFGGVDVLVNNAGIFPSVPMLRATPELFDRVYRVNLKGLAFLSQALGNRLVAQGRGGAIVNVGSIDSLRPSQVGLAAYDASKGGVLMFTRSFALEMAPHGVRVNAVLPGAVKTEGTSRPLAGSGMTEAQMEAFLDDFVKRRVPLGRIGQPDDIATAIVFLASDAARYVTGAHLVVDGGTLLT